MAECDGIQEIVNQAAIQESAVMIVIRDMDVGSQLAPTASPREAQRQRHGALDLEEPSVHWNAQHRNMELLNFKMEAMSSLETKAYELTDKEKVPVIKN